MMRQWQWRLGACLVCVSLSLPLSVAPPFPSLPLSATLRISPYLFSSFCFVTFTAVKFITSFPAGQPLTG